VTDSDGAPDAATAAAKTARRSWIKWAVGLVLVAMLGALALFVALVRFMMAGEAASLRASRPTPPPD